MNNVFWNVHGMEFMNIETETVAASSKNSVANHLRYIEELLFFQSFSSSKDVELVNLPHLCFGSNPVKIAGNKNNYPESWFYND